MTGAQVASGQGDGRRRSESTKALINGGHRPRGNKTTRLNCTASFVFTNGSVLEGYERQVRVGEAISMKYKHSYKETLWGVSGVQTCEFDELTSQTPKALPNNVRPQQY